MTDEVFEVPVVATGLLAEFAAAGLISASVIVQLITPPSWRTCGWSRFSFVPHIPFSVAT